MDTDGILKKCLIGNVNRRILGEDEKASLDGRRQSVSVGFWSTGKFDKFSRVLDLGIQNSIGFSLMTR